MAIEKKTIRLLILEDSQNEAERLVSLFRNAGHATRVHRLTSPEDLAETLQQSWDLLIAAPTSECLEPGEALATCAASRATSRSSSWWPTTAPTPSPTP